jgi:hypothetical protein
MEKRREKKSDDRKNLKILLRKCTTPGGIMRADTEFVTFPLAHITLRACALTPGIATCKALPLKKLARFAEGPTD